mgnify:CR=1 FL=1
MPYLDGTESDALDRPQWCPFCKGKLASRWRGQTQGFVGRARGASEVAWPFFVCLKCEITVRVARLPVEPLRTTRKAAKADAAKIIAADLATYRSTRGEP